MPRRPVAQTGGLPVSYRAPGGFLPRDPVRAADRKAVGGRGVLRLPVLVLAEGSRDAPPRIVAIRPGRHRVPAADHRPAAAGPRRPPGRPWPACPPDPA